jgi:DNA-directed RNA polymerase subunit RPC12/RpoP
MTEVKLSCPKCSEHIAFPIEMAGREIACPHCGETILLSKPRRTGFWIAGSIAVSVFVVTSVMMFGHPSHPKPAENGPPGQSNRLTPKLRAEIERRLAIASEHYTNILAKLEEANSKGMAAAKHLLDLQMTYAREDHNASAGIKATEEYWNNMSKITDDYLQAKTRARLEYISVQNDCLLLLQGVTTQYGGK